MVRSVEEFQAAKATALDGFKEPRKYCVYVHNHKKEDGSIGQYIGMGDLCRALSRGRESYKKEDHISSHIIADNLTAGEAAKIEKYLVNRYANELSNKIKFTTKIHELIGFYWNGSEFVWLGEAFFANLDNRKIRAFLKSHKKRGQVSRAYGTMGYIHISCCLNLRAWCHKDGEKFTGSPADISQYAGTKESGSFNTVIKGTDNRGNRNTAYGWSIDQKENKKLQRYIKRLQEEETRRKWQGN